MRVVHQTPGYLPVEALTVAGLSAKPNSTSPIGKFGTGLKYSIAVLVRNNIKVQLFIGLTEYVFYKTTRKFRGSEYEQIRMKKRHGLNPWKYFDMPFTTQYGKYWELWQVYRELHANTLDENGETFFLAPGEECAPKEDHTTFIIESAAYADVYHERGKIFLEDGKRSRDESEAIQIIDRPSKHIYFRSMRVMDLAKEAQFTYNFLEDVSLTEDRTLKYPSLMESRLVGVMQESSDKSFLAAAVTSPKEASYESSLDHRQAYSPEWYAVTPKVAYLEAARTSSNLTAREVWNKAQPTVPATVSVRVIFKTSELTPGERKTFEELCRSFKLGTEVVFDSC